MVARFQYGTDTLTIQSALALCAGTMKGVLGDKAVQQILKSQLYVNFIVAGDTTVYGINTGFGILANTSIPAEDTRLLQHKILQSHSVGVGKPIHPEIAKLMMITKVHSLARGYSGIQLETLERIIWHIDNDIIPLCPRRDQLVLQEILHPLPIYFCP
jgi:histidine ammonia-lyase